MGTIASRSGATLDDHALQTAKKSTATEESAPPLNPVADSPEQPTFKLTNEQPAAYKAPDDSEVLGSSAGKARQRILEIGAHRPAELTHTPPPYRTLPRLDHNLDRVLFNPGVHVLLDPRTQVFNYDPWLRDVPPPNQFDFDKLAPFITPSQDQRLARLAKRRAARYVGSTSSMTSVMSHVYFLVSQWRRLNLATLSSRYATKPDTYTRGMRVPASVYLRYRKGSEDSYAVDAEKTLDVEDTILQLLGKSMERFLTLPRSEFRKLLKARKGKFDLDADMYNYADFGKFLIRSQLDCYDARLPKKTFDLKSRATVAVRLMKDDFDSATEYRIKYNSGTLESFEREYFDMIRSAFLKYNFQARIGDMDGIFVAYHNTKSVFGFQYIPREEMDWHLFGSPRNGDRYFRSTLQLLEQILDTVTARYPRRHLLMSFEAIRNKNRLVVYTEVVPEGQKDSAMTLNAEKKISYPADTVVSRFMVEGILPTSAVSFGPPSAFDGDSDDDSLRMSEDEDGDDIDDMGEDIVETGGRHATKHDAPAPKRFRMTEDQGSPAEVLEKYTVFRQNQLLYFEEELLAETDGVKPVKANDLFMEHLRRTCENHKRENDWLAQHPAKTSIWRPKSK
ncbi:hypothetical protein IWQ60_001709 [Tieghemiomyces parasiticus]|uniref:Pet127-domain-containing protein n=1 Tax=Tieghemiomyces parasiticus TaxID=78921 RepID=A0A9W8ACJ9_9FUNG|nr:hypothetical protein IWQ60_001709 [Tieghemiomyces parasiticus]